MFNIIFADGFKIIHQNTEKDKNKMNKMMFNAATLYSWSGFIFCFPKAQYVHIQ